MVQVEEQLVQGQEGKNDRLCPESKHETLSFNLNDPSLQCIKPKGMNLQVSRNMVRDLLWGQPTHSGNPEMYQVALDLVAEENVLVVKYVLFKAQDFLLSPPLTSCSNEVGRALVPKQVPCILQEGLFPLLRGGCVALSFLFFLSPVIRYMIEWLVSRVIIS